MERSQLPRSPLIWTPFYLMITMSTWSCRAWSISPSRRNTEPCIPWKNYADGARLAYALASPENDVTLKDLAKLCDVFYIGGTKCGALFGEAVVIPDPALIPHFFTIIKQHGALFAKGRILGIQFDTLFTDDLYLHIGESALDCAAAIKSALKENGYQFFLETPTNQIFIILEDEVLHRLEEQAEFSFWEKYDDSHTVIRIATSWATTKEHTDALIELLKMNRA